MNNTLFPIGRVEPVKTPIMMHPKTYERHRTLLVRVYTGLGWVCLPLFRTKMRGAAFPLGPQYGAGFVGFPFANVPPKTTTTRTPTGGTTTTIMYTGVACHVMYHEYTIRQPTICSTGGTMDKEFVKIVAVGPGRFQIRGRNCSEAATFFTA